MRLLRAISTLNPASGGPAATLTPITKELMSSGHTVEVVCFDNPADPWLNDSPFVVHCLESKSSFYQRLNKLYHFLRANSHGYDCVIVHGLWSAVDFAVWRALRHTSTPYVVLLHGILTPWFNRRYPRKYVKKYLYWLAYQHRILVVASAVLSFSEEEQLMASQSFWPYNCNGAVVKYGTAGPPEENGLSGIFYDRFPHLEDKQILLYLGRIHYNKGCDILIEAFARLSKEISNVHLVMAGPDQLGWKDALASRANELGVGSRITWTGLLVGDMKWGALLSSDVFVLPTHHDNHSVAMVEALACGVPVLITDKLFQWREIEASGSGLVATDSVDGLSDIFLQWFTMDPEEQALMRKCAVKAFRSNFDAKIAAESLCSIIEDLLISKNSSRAPRQII
jgi:glycosyltransferase involved in cell wall biosynthesis